KCIEEGKSGSGEFRTAAESTKAAIAKMNLPEADVFLKEVLPAYELTLDELKD
ncbi:MAG: 5'-deoxynucleotidase, partial [Clostridia bacterium]|nr:5'-deoxynucleotidase [Clostridia bacterium]